MLGSSQGSSYPEHSSTGVRRAARRGGAGSVGMSVASRRGVCRPGSSRPPRQRIAFDDAATVRERVEGAAAGLKLRGARRHVLAAVGFDVSAPLDVDPGELLGRQAIVRLETQETRRRSDGRPQRRSRVTYDGWAPAGGVSEGTSTEKEAISADAMPF